jgi:phospholipase C
MTRLIAGLYLTTAAAAAALAGCAGERSPPRPTATEAEQQRAACAYQPGTKAAQTLAAELPTGRDLPVDHIVLVMQENRSFDHYFSELDLPGLDGAARSDSNPDSHGNRVPRFHLPSKCATSPDHGWATEHHNFDGGKNDGFVTANGDGAFPMGYYDGGDLPYYYALARAFAFSDRHFSSALAPTWPNRMFYFAGTSWGLVSNTFPGLDPRTNQPYPTLFSALDAAGVEWRTYAQTRPTPLIADLRAYLDHRERFLVTDDFAADVAAGKLAAVTIVEGSTEMGARSADDGPPSDVDIGQEFVSGIIRSVMESPFWQRSVIFLSYDENGGFYDHVVPPAACPPDELPPSDDGPDRFDQLGFRVPFFVISPYARRGYLSHTVTDHTDILRFVEARFGLPALTRRDANASAAFDMFDFAHPDFSVPALPTVTVDEAALAACAL